ncbi:hypothetical protein [Vibrio nigripulchritudo]|uniref:hypothetical protein n=1 Tax=Vibrio nigripulchritudo TaxID=28173 RepID=UPI000409AE0D|nr:hypothetical protein [Vibrio nigripulchritudo]KJY79100.1 hypothetical protein TW74_10455 [Vibrio nigripulchritudo]
MKKFLIVAIAASLSACGGGSDDSGSSSNKNSSNNKSSFNIQSRPDIALTEAQISQLRSESFSALNKTGFKSPKHFE